MSVICLRGKTEKQKNSMGCPDWLGWLAWHVGLHGLVDWLAYMTGLDGWAARL